MVRLHVVGLLLLLVIFFDETKGFHRKCDVADDSYNDSYDYYTEEEGKFRFSK